jgi:hypothetical protein
LSKYVFLKFHACPEGLILIWFRNPFRGNSNYWQFSKEEAGRIIPERQSEMKRVLQFKFATWNVRGLEGKEEELDKRKIPLKFQ